jgi:predicted permease
VFSLRPLLRGLRGLFRPGAADRDVADEVRHYFDEVVAAHVARGLSTDQAVREARRDVGQTSVVREQVLDYGWETTVSSLARDVRYAARRLRRDAIFTIVAVVTLAGGIGTATAIVAASAPVLFEPLPYPDAARLTAIVEATPSGGARNPGTFGMFVHLAERTRSFDAMAVMRSWQPVLTGVEPPERLDGQRVSADYFRVLGVSPAIGRDLQADDDRAGASAVVVLSHRLWRRSFAGDPSIIGRSVRLDEIAHVVVGVMPADFENVLDSSAEIWTPLQYSLSDGRAWGHHLQTIGRLGRGVGIEAATGDVLGAGRAILREIKPETYDPDTRFSVVRLKDDLVRGVRPAFAAVLGAVALLLAIACVNVTNLLLARSVGRRGELALRSALGASRWRLAQQLITESVILAGLGGAAGLLLARLVVDAVVALAPLHLFRLQAITPAGPVFWCGIALTTMIGVGLGVLSALHAGGRDLRADLGAASLRSTGARRPARRALVIVQVALALVLLVGSGLLLRSLGRLLAIDPGFKPAGVLTLQVQVSGRRFAAAGAAAQFFDRTLDAVRAVPGVAAAGMTSQLPLSGDLDAYGTHFEASPTRPAETHSVFRYAVSHGYLEALGIPLREGRFFDAGDRADAPRVAVISESLARRRFATASPVGARLRIGPADGAPYTIVGVVGSVRQMTLAAGETDAVYTPAAQWDFPELVGSLVIRTPGDPRALVSPVREAIRSVDKDQPIVRVAPMADVVLATAAERRFVLRLFQGFTLVALVLAAAGIYGLLAGSVAERTREIGVRSVLGASRSAILSLVVGEGVSLAAAGAVAGLFVAVSCSRLIAGLLFGVSRFDPWTYIVAVAVLLGVTLGACIAPAWRAVRIDPATTLRAE